MATAVYQNHLEHELRRLGYSIERGTNHAPDIKGYTPEYLAAESLRTAEIKQGMEERGVTGREAESYVKHQNREEKLKLNPDQLRQLHRENAERFGNQPARIVAEASAKLTREFSPEKAEQKAHAAVLFARERLGERSAVFDHFEVVRDALRHTQGRATLEDIYAELQSQKEHGQFVEVQHVRPNAPAARYTTPELINVEREAIERIKFGQGAVTPIAAVTDAQIAQRYPAFCTGHAARFDG